MVCCGRVTLTFVEESEAKKKHRCNVNFSIWDSQYHDVMVSFHCNIEILCFSDCRLRFNLWIFYHCYVMVSIPEKNTYMICVCVIIVENSNNFKTKNQIGCNLILHSYSLHPHSRVPFIFLSVLSPTKPWFTGVFFRQMMNAENRVTSRSPVTASSSTSVGTCCKVPGWKLKRYDMLLEDQHFPRRPFKKSPGWFGNRPITGCFRFDRLEILGTNPEFFQISTCFAATRWGIFQLIRFENPSDQLVTHQSPTNLPEIQCCHWLSHKKLLGYAEHESSPLAVLGEVFTPSWTLVNGHPNLVDS